MDMDTEQKIEKISESTLGVLGCSIFLYAFGCQVYRLVIKLFELGCVTWVEVLIPIDLWARGLVVLVIFFFASIPLIFLAVVVLCIIATIKEVK